MTWRPLRLFLVIVVCLFPLRLLAMPPQQPWQQPISISLSTDHWTVVPLPFQAIWVGSHNGDLWACGWNEGIAKSSDGGKTWQVVHFRKNGEICLSLSFDGSQVLAPTTGGHVLRSRDGGKTWDGRIQLSIRPKSITLCGDAAIALTPKLVAYAPNLRHARWSVLSVKPPASPSGSPDVLDGVQVACQDATHWGILVAGYPSRFYTTANGGANWSVLAFATSLNFSSLVARNGIYDLIGEKDVTGSPSKGLLLYSSDGKKWGSMPEPLPDSIGLCFMLVCRANLHWEDFHTSPPRFWHLPKGGPRPAPSQAFSKDVTCAAGPQMACAIATSVSAPRTRPAPPKRGGTINLECRKCSLPGYPETAKEDKCLGQVAYDSVLNRRGSMTNLVLVYAPCVALAVSTRANLKRWRFTPAIMNGKPVSIEFPYTVTYKKP